MFSNVLRDGATSWGNPKPMRPALPLGTGYRNLTVNRDRDAGLRLIATGPFHRRLLQATSRMRVQGDWTWQRPRKYWHAWVSPQRL